MINSEPTEFHDFMGGGAFKVVTKSLSRSEPQLRNQNRSATNMPRLSFGCSGNTFTRETHCDRNMLDRNIEHRIAQASQDRPCFAFFCHAFFCQKMSFIRSKSTGLRFQVKVHVDDISIQRRKQFEAVRPLATQSGLFDDSAQSLINSIHSGRARYAASQLRLCRQGQCPCQ